MNEILEAKIIGINLENEIKNKLTELIVKNKLLKDQVKNLKSDVQLYKEILNSTQLTIHQEEKNGLKLGQRCILF